MLYRSLRVSQCLTRFDEWTLRDGRSPHPTPLISTDGVENTRDVTDHLQLLLRKSGYHLHTTAEKEVVRLISASSHPLALDVTDLSSQRRRLATSLCLRQRRRRRDKELEGKSSSYQTATSSACVSFSLPSRLY